MRAFQPLPHALTQHYSSAVLIGIWKVLLVWNVWMNRSDTTTRDVVIDASWMMRPEPVPYRYPTDTRGAKTGTLVGKRVLVVEDEMLLALDLEEALHREGSQVIGPAGNLRQAMQLAEGDAVDAAILDVNLAGEPVFPVAKLLLARRIPFVFATAYSGTDEIYPAEVRAAPRLSKPYTISQALTLLQRLVTD
jgi:CheY-like chemotaxis protein